MTQDQKLDEALKGTFPASDAFYLSPDDSRPAAGPLSLQECDALDVRGMGKHVDHAGRR
jgi:hypothetical protein